MRTHRSGPQELRPAKGEGRPVVHPAFHRASEQILDSKVLEWFLSMKSVSERRHRNRGFPLEEWPKCRRPQRYRTTRTPLTPGNSEFAVANAEPGPRGRRQLDDWHPLSSVR